jgi:hypothetical protein
MGKMFSRNWARTKRISQQTTKFFTHEQWGLNLNKDNTVFFGLYYRKTAKNNASDSIALGKPMFL